MVCDFAAQSVEGLPTIPLADSESKRGSMGSV